MACRSEGGSAERIRDQQPMHLQRTLRAVVLEAASSIRHPNIFSSRCAGKSSQFGHILGALASVLASEDAEAQRRPLSGATFARTRCSKHGLDFVADRCSISPCATSSWGKPAKGDRMG